MQRLLILLPWLMERGGATGGRGGRALPGQRDRRSCATSSWPRAAVCRPYLDEMIDVFVEDGEIHVGVPRLFTRPLRLTPSEGFALLAAGRAAQQLPGADADGPLARALAKLAQAVGGDAERGGRRGAPAVPRRRAGRGRRRRAARPHLLRGVAATS